MSEIEELEIRAKERRERLTMPSRDITGYGPPPTFVSPEHAEAEADLFDRAITLAIARELQMEARGRDLEQIRADVLKARHVISGTLAKVGNHSSGIQMEWFEFLNDTAHYEQSPGEVMDYEEAVKVASSALAEHISEQIPEQNYEHEFAARIVLDAIGYRDRQEELGLGRRAMKALAGAGGQALRGQSDLLSGLVSVTEERDEARELADQLARYVLNAANPAYAGTGERLRLLAAYEARSWKPSTTYQTHSIDSDSVQLVLAPPGSTLPGWEETSPGVFERDKPSTST